MDTLRFILSLALSSFSLSALADSPPRPGMPVPPQPQPGITFNQPTPRPQLNKNYQITLVVTSHEKSVGELTVLTCSPSIQVEATIDLTETPTSMGLTGMLTEKEDHLLLLDYNLRFNVPITTSTVNAQPQPQPANVVRNIQYQQHSVAGSLRMKPGDEYEFLKAAGRTYSLRITPKED